MTVNFNPMQAMAMIHTYAKNQGQRSVGKKTEWKQTNKRTDTTDRSTLPTNMVNNKFLTRLLHMGCYTQDSSTDEVHVLCE